MFTLIFAFNLLTLSGYQTRDSLSLQAIKKQVVCSKLSMLVLCSIILAEASWGIRRETMTLKDLHGGTVLTAISQLNQAIRDHVSPSAPFTVDLAQVRSNFAHSQPHLESVCWTSMGLHSLKMVLTVLAALCYANHVSEVASCCYRERSVEVEEASSQPESVATIVETSTPARTT